MLKGWVILKEWLCGFISIWFNCIEYWCLSFCAAISFGSTRSPCFIRVSISVGRHFISTSRTIYTASKWVCISYLEQDTPGSGYGTHLTAGHDICLLPYLALAWKPIICLETSGVFLTITTPSIGRVHQHARWDHLGDDLEGLEEDLQQSGPGGLPIQKQRSTICGPAQLGPLGPHGEPLSTHTSELILVFMPAISKLLTVLRPAIPSLVQKNGSCRLSKIPSCYTTGV